MKSSARGVGQLLRMVATAREGRKGGHRRAATLSQVVEKKKLGNGDEKTKRIRNPGGGRDSGGWWSGHGPTVMGRDNGRRGRLQSATTVVARRRGREGEEVEELHFWECWGSQAAVWEEEDGNGSGTIVGEEGPGQPQLQRRPEKVGGRERKSCTSGMPGKSGLGPGGIGRRWVGDGGQRGRLRSATTVATAARRRGRPGEEELHFRNAGEVRPRSGHRRTAMGWGRWSEMKTLIGHNSGGGGGGSGQKKRAAERG